MNPLTKEQQALIVQWLPFANGLAIKFLRARPNLRYLEDECFAAAKAAGVTAMQKWEPQRGTYASCLAWWVRAALQEVERGYVARHETISLHERTYRTSAGAMRRTWQEENPTLAEMLPDDATSPDTRTDASILYAGAEDELTRRLLARGRYTEAQARENVRYFLRWLAHGEMKTEIAERMGIYRQAVDQRLDRVQPIFDEWAEELRQEAA